MGLPFLGLMPPWLLLAILLGQCAAFTSTPASSTPVRARRAVVSRSAQPGVKPSTAVSPPATYLANAVSPPANYLANAVKAPGDGGGDSSSRVLSLDGVDGLTAAIAETSARGQVLAVRYHAAWCRACRAFAPKFATLAREYGAPSAGGVKVVFATLDIARLDATAPFTRQLLERGGLPFIQLYQGADTPVKAFVCPPGRIEVLRRNLEQTLDPDAAEEQTRRPASV